MILDNISNMQKYDTLIPVMSRCKAAIEAFGCDAPRIEIDGDHAFGLYQEVTTASPDKQVVEHHKRYIDMHYVIKGEERIDFCPRKDCEATTEFDAAGDYELCTMAPDHSTVILHEGEFALVFPGEAHKTKVAVDGDTDIKKIVFKIEAELN